MVIMMTYWRRFIRRTITCLIELEDEFSFWRDRRVVPLRIRAGCRDFTVAEARAHWGPGGASDRPDCLALVEKLANGEGA